MAASHPPRRKESRDCCYYMAQNTPLAPEGMVWPVFPAESGGEGQRRGSTCEQGLALCTAPVLTVSVMGG